MDMAQVMTTIMLALCKTEIINNNYEYENLGGGRDGGLVADGAAYSTGGTQTLAGTNTQSAANNGGFGFGGHAAWGCSGGGGYYSHIYSFRLTRALFIRVLFI